MGTLEKIMQMKSRGISEPEIIESLRQEGVSPKEISDALNQASIKSAVSDDNKMEEQTPPPTPNPNEQVPVQGQDTLVQNEYLVPPSDVPSQQETQEQIPQQDYYSQEAYDPYSSAGMGGYETAVGYEGNSDTMIEIAEQVFSKKMKKFQKQLDDASELKALTETKINHISERLKRIESIIDKLQMTVLEEVGSYGKNLEGIKREMSMMQESFGKMIPKLATHPHAIHQTSHKKTRKKKSPKKK